MERPSFAFVARRGWVVAAAAALWTHAATAQACATCELGDPTLTTFGLGQPFAQRLRIGARYAWRTTEIGDGTPDAFQLRHQETALVSAYTPVRWLTLDLDMPLVHRQVERRSGAVSRTTHVGDAAAGLRVRLWARPRLRRSQHLWAVGRLIVPTSPRLEGANGLPRPLEEQTGTGAFVPQLGLGYAHTGGPLGGFATARIEIPSQGFARSRPSRGLFVTLAAQWQPLHWLGLRLGWEQGYETSAREIDGREDPDSGGILWSASLNLLLAPMPDLVVQLGGQLPLWQHLRGQHRELPVLLASVLYDLDGDG